MPNLSMEVLNEAFIRPIRFAMLLDDQFPTYPEALADDRNDQYDYKRATGLFALCREQGWLCDVDNRAKIAVKFEDEKHLHQSDLLILDFHLDPSNVDDPSEALGIVQKLARSSHFNMVILYTSEKPNTVIKDVAFAVGAGNAPLADDETFIRLLEDLDPEIEKEISEYVTSKLITNFLLGKSPLSDLGGLSKRLIKVGIKPPQQAVLLNNACAEKLRARCSKSVSKNRVHGSRVNGNYSDDDNVKWLICDNVFVAVANKNTTAPENILGVLRAALQAWDPTPLQVMMIHARSALEKVGNVSDNTVLSDSARQAGWLLPILLAPEGASRDQGLLELYGRLFNRLINAVGPSVNQVGKMLLNGHAGPALSVSKSLARNESLTDREVYHALNEHLCSEEHPDGAITTGVVFHDARANEFWLCATPACDLVPGRKKGGALDPWLPIAAVKLEAVKKDLAIDENLRVAEQGNHIFMRISGKPFVLQALDPISRQMVIENILLRNEGIIADRKMSGCRAKMDENGHPVWHLEEFVVVGRLRTSYADRLLAAAGSHRARIGVDFINMPSAPPITTVNFSGGRYKMRTNPIGFAIGAANPIKQHSSITVLNPFKGIDNYRVQIQIEPSPSNALATAPISADASSTGTALPTCTPPAISPPENTNSSGNV